jgi:hypothetical protein
MEKPVTVTTFPPAEMVGLWELVFLVPARLSLLLTYVTLSGKFTVRSRSVQLAVLGLFLTVTL